MISNLCLRWQRSWQKPVHHQSGPWLSICTGFCSGAAKFLCPAKHESHACAWLKAGMRLRPDSGCTRLSCWGVLVEVQPRLYSLRMLNQANLLQCTPWTSESTSGLRDHDVERASLRTSKSCKLALSQLACCQTSKLHPRKLTHNTATAWSVHNSPADPKVCCCSCFDDARSRETVLQALVRRACGVGDAVPAEDRSAEGHKDTHPAPPRGLHGAGTLLDVLQPHPDCYGSVLQLMMATAQSAMQQVCSMNTSRLACSVAIAADLYTFAAGLLQSSR